MTKDPIRLIRLVSSIRQPNTIRIGRVGVDLYKTEGKRKVPALDGLPHPCFMRLLPQVSPNPNQAMLVATREMRLSDIEKENESIGFINFKTIQSIDLGVFSDSLDNDTYKKVFDIIYDKKTLKGLGLSNKDFIDAVNWFYDFVMENRNNFFTGAETKYLCIEKHIYLKR